MGGARAAATPPSVADAGAERAATLPLLPCCRSVYLARPRAPPARLLAIKHIKPSRREHDGICATALRETPTAAASSSCVQPRRCRAVRIRPPTLPAFSMPPA